MATADDSSLTKELECPICADEYCRPVTAGPCNHTFCKHCLQRYVETKARNGEFPCPLCRKPCKLPPNGIDGLTPNFTVANIIEKYSKVRKQLNQLKWNSCSHCLDSNTNVGSSLACPKCDGISLCYDCGLRHVNHPLTKSHQVISICKLHGKPLSKYCMSCGRAICVVCFGKHSKSEEHDVVDYIDLVKGDMAELEQKSRSAGPASCQLKKQEEKLKTLRTEREKEATQVRKKIVTDFRVGEDRIDEGFTKYRERFEFHQQQMKLMKQKMDDVLNRKRKIQEIQNSYLCMVEKDFEAEREDVTAAIQTVIDMQGRVEESVSRSDTLVTQKLLKAELHDDIVETRNKLLKLTNAAAIDRVTSFRERRRPKYDLREEYIAAAGQFSSATSSFELEIGRRDCIVGNVTFMSRDRIAASIRVENGTFAVVTWNLSDKTENVLLKDMCFIPYIASFGLNKLVVLRRASPILKVINVDTKATRHINVDIPQVVIDIKLWCVEVDDRGRFMVTYHDCDRKFHTLLISNEGHILHDLRVRGYKPTFCRLTGMVTLCTNAADTISCYQVNDDSLTEVMSAPHAVKGFECTDICSGSLGEMFIVGQMKGNVYREIRLYQLLLDTDKKTVSMNQIEITDLEPKSNFRPTCSINGNNLVISYGNAVHVLQLSARVD